MDKYGAVETLGPVVHNQRVVDSLAQKGVIVVASPEETKGRSVAITSHGVPPQVRQDLQSRGLTVIDTTCPNVQKAQRAAKELSESGFGVVVYGDPNHPEVKGILGWAIGGGMATIDSQAVACRGKTSANGPNLPPRLGLLSQTTRNPDMFAGFISDVICSLLPDIEEIRVINTLCNITRKRQLEAVELAGRVDMMIVVGGRNSANTRCLAEMCMSTGTETHHVETADEINEAWLKDKTSIGVTTGTSISDQVTEEVMHKLRTINQNLHSSSH